MRHAENYEKFTEVRLREAKPTPDKSDAVKSVVENQSSYAPVEPIPVVNSSRFDQLSEVERKPNEPVSMVKVNRLLKSDALYLIIISRSLFHLLLHSARTFVNQTKPNQNLNATIAVLSLPTKKR